MERQFNKLQQLLEQENWTEEDKKWLLSYLELNNSTELQQLMQQYFTLHVNSAGQPRNERAQFLLRVIHSKIKTPAIKSQKYNLWRRISAAAAILFIVLGSGFMYFLIKNNITETFAEKEINQATHIVPGGSKAILTLADGGEIVLDSAANGMITQQESAQIIKTGNGILEYKAEESGSEKITYNSVSTPVGGTYQLTLSDGTKVWLNAASSIRFPAVFHGKERIVSILGEVYFEVNPQIEQNSTKKIKPKAVPFYVDVAGKGVVEVTGTHFNINSYTNEPAVKTTLIEGSIRFQSGSMTDKVNQKSVILIPGQQAELAPDGALQVNNNVDIEKAMAWKNGYFMFSSSTVHEVMNQISRWYDVDVIYESKITDEKFGGKIQRNLNLPEVLEILKKNNYKFKIEGRKLYMSQ